MSTAEGRPVALVTGAASGIGRSVALALARAGYDVADDAGVRAMLKAVQDGFGRLDVLINNAGTTTEVKPGDLEAMTVEEWDRVFAVNVRGVFLVTRAAAAPLCREQGRRGQPDQDPRLPSRSRYPRQRRGAGLDGRRLDAADA